MRKFRELEDCADCLCRVCARNIYNEFLASGIPNSGGIISVFTGENDMDDFGEQIVSFGKSIAKFSTIVSGHVNEESAQAAANIGQMMTDLASGIPNSGGIISVFTGENDMDDFGDQIVSFGLALCRFSECVKDISSDDVRGRCRTQFNIYNDES